MLLGTSKIIITPKNKVRLAGYATRETVFEDVLEDIYVRVFWLNNTELNKDEVIIYGDLIWFGEDFVPEAIEKIQRKFPELKKENIYFVASHNHSGPPTSNCFTELLETYNREYAVFLINQITNAVGDAYEDREIVTACRYNDEIKLNVYRRVMLNHEILMKPNYEHACNHDLNIIVFKNKDSEIKGAIVHYPCHANISNENNIMPDFPGLVLKKMDEMFKNSISIFMQGATADIRPNVVLGDQFIALGYNHAEKFSEILFQKIVSTIKREEGILLKSEPSSKEGKVFKLPQTELITSKELEGIDVEDKPEKRQWLEKIKVKDFRLYEEMKINYLAFGKELEFYFFNSELSQNYETYIKSINPNALAVSYANGMIGYVCDKSQILEGGYEPIGSTVFFALTGAYKPEIEEIIKDNILEINRGDES